MVQYCTMVAFQIGKYWTEERRIEFTNLNSDKHHFKQSFLYHKNQTTLLEAELKQAQLNLDAKQRELHELEDSDLTYKNPAMAKERLAQLEDKYRNQTFSSAREEQLIINEIERHKRNVTKLLKYTPILEECKRLEGLCKVARQNHRVRLKIHYRDKFEF